MKKIVFILCWGLFWSANAGFPTRESVAGSSGVNSNVRENAPVGESSNLNPNLSQAVGEITEGVGSLSCGDGSPYTDAGSRDWYFCSGANSLRIILDQSQKKIETLQEKSVVNQREIDRQQLVISRQERYLNDKDQQVSSLKRKADSLQEQVEEKNRQIVERNREFSIVEQERKQFEKRLFDVVQERDHYKKENQGFKDSLNAMLAAMNNYVESWSSDENLRKRYGDTSDPREKLVIGLTHLFEHGARREEFSQSVSVSNIFPRKCQEDFSLNTIVDAERHGFLVGSEEDDQFYEVGGCKYRGATDENRKPNGEGEIFSDVMKIKGTFKKGFLDISKDTTFECDGYSGSFKFPGKFSDDYLELISFVDISEMRCSLSMGRLLFKHSDGGVSFVFSEKYVYVGNLSENNYPGGLGVKFNKDGRVDYGKFKNGFLASKMKYEEVFDNFSASKAKCGEKKNDRSSENNAKRQRLN